MPIADLDGLALYHELHNPDGGATVALLHGLGSCGDDWPFQLPALAPRYRVLTLDLPGHGRSSLPRPWPSVVDYARAVLGLLDRLGEPAAHLVGLSLGGAVSLQIALDCPKRVRSLTLVNSFARLRSGPTGTARGMLRLALVCLGPMAWVGRWVAAGLFPRPDQAALRQAAAARLASNPRRAYLAALSAAARFDVRARLGAVGCPTLIVAGDRDQTLPLAAKRELANGIGSARLVVVRDSGHATPLDQPEAFNEVLLSFLEGVESRASV
ncbi:MAG: alpha/beta hydrolase [Chloroflexota bacterium]